ncbi:hypothetical protein CRE_01472 [Caenorhabditis remanei]|uniref:DUF7154 domain-containing protein n=1 Tax=Caenorhabditis remanei TaxID=31234 RepID=E3NQH6_CAERE|nr:hypothetical protein CRE_01472 [Caenorhabditis remanei]
MTVTSDQTHAKIVESAGSPAACLPSYNVTVLYAYSTDIDYDTYFAGASNIVYYAVGYTTLANVRFDTKQEEEIEYHTNYTSLDASLNSHKPDPSLGYGDKTTGSNLYSVLKKFLYNGNVSLCGAQVYIAVKRYPDESDVSDLITQLQSNHVMVYITVDSVPLGGSNSATLYEMSYETNGYCGFAAGSALQYVFNWMTNTLSWPYQFFAQNFVVSGSGRIEIPAFKTPIPIGLSRTLDNSFGSVNYTVESTDGFVVMKFSSDYVADFNGTAQSFWSILNGSLSYKWTVDHHYKTNAPQIIQLRMYSEYYHDFLPLPDF